MKQSKLTIKQKDIIYSVLIGIIGLSIMLITCLIYSSINNSFGNFFEVIQKLDANHYKLIVDMGYNYSSTAVYTANLSVCLWNGMSVCAFFPLYPLIIKIISIITFGIIDPYLIGLIISTICMSEMIYFLIQFLRLKNVKINYFIISILFVFNTFFMFYFNFYTEAIYMMIIAIFLYLCEKKKFFSCGICLALLSATRVTGVFFAFYLFYKIYINIEMDTNNLNKFQIFLRKIWQILKTPYYLASLSISFLGLALFIISLNKIFGLSPLAFLDAQVGWGKQNKLPFYYIFNSLFFGDVSSKMIALFMIAGLVFCIYLILKEKKYFIPLFIIFYILSITMSSITSADRYLWDLLLLTIEFYSLFMNKTKEYKVNNNTVKLKVLNTILYSTLTLVVTFCIVAFINSLIFNNYLFY